MRLKTSICSCCYGERQDGKVSLCSQPRDYSFHRERWSLSSCVSPLPNGESPVARASGDIRKIKKVHDERQSEDWLLGVLQLLSTRLFHCRQGEKGWSQAKLSSRFSSATPLDETGEEAIQLTRTMSPSSWSTDMPVLRSGS
jgi:hypothetical protein